MRALYILMAVMAISALSAEKKIRIQDAPAAVQAAVKEQTKNATLVGLTKEVENGQTLYEAETKMDGKTRDVLIDGNGAVVAVEQEVALASVPSPAKAAIEKKATGGKVTKVEAITKGSTVTYEAAITKAGKKSELVVAADGTEVKE